MNENNSKKMIADTASSPHGEGNSKQNEATHVSAMGSDASKSKSVSASSDPDVGFVVTNNHLRSVLMHPMGLPLLCFLNNINAANHVAYVKTALDDFNSSDDTSLRSLRENVFAATVLDWEGGETDLTAKLMFNIKLCNIGTSLVTPDEEKWIVGNDGQRGRVDYIFSEKQVATDEKSSIVALFEFGLENHNWWTKLHQVLKYVALIRTNEDPNYKIDQPILLSALTINSTSKIVGDSKKRALTVNEDLTDEAKDKAKKKAQKKTFKSNLVTITENKNNINDRRFDARFGVFLCTPKGNDDYRITLLWRYTTRTLNDASVQFGKILHAVQLCSYLRKYCNDHKDTIQYKYLGPNCCKIGDMLLRSYDNRLRWTNRRPYLYLKPSVIDNNGSDRMAEKVLEIPDGRSPVVFGELKPTGNERPIDWLWRHQGQLLIISTLYHVGVHYAKHPLHFQPIINHLQQLHEQGFVHGDIRAYNMVFQYSNNNNNDNTSSSEVVAGQSNDSGNDCKGWLIDFDFGGINAAVTYPTGYQKLFQDGRRPGEEGNVITIMDDWKSLIGLIFHTHTFEIKQGVELTNDQKISLFDMEKELEGYRRRNVDGNDIFLSHAQPLIALLHEYIEFTSYICDVKLEPEFERDLRKCGLWSTRQSLNASAAATGSPRK